MQTDLNRDRHTEPFERAPDSSSLLPFQYNDDHHPSGMGDYATLGLASRDTSALLFPRVLAQGPLADVLTSSRGRKMTSSSPGIQSHGCGDIIMDSDSIAISRLLRVTRAASHVLRGRSRIFCTSCHGCVWARTASPYRCYLRRQCSQLPSAPQMRKCTAIVTACAARGGKMLAVRCSPAFLLTVI